MILLAFCLLGGIVVFTLSINERLTKIEKRLDDEAKRKGDNKP